MTQDINSKEYSDSIKAIIRKMVENQQTLNSTAYSDTWLEKGKSGEWDYAMAASLEIAEFSNSFWLPWWSKAEQDMANCRIEIVDAAHFMLSIALIVMDGNVDDAVEWITESFFLATVGISKEDAANTNQLSKNLQASLNGRTSTLFTDLFRLSNSIGFDLNKLFALYMGKSTLNKFRQDNGYKQGTYNKKWDGKREDNYFLSVWVGEQEVAPTAEQVRAWLDAEYPKYLQK